MMEIYRPEFQRLAPDTGNAETKPVQAREAIKYFTICPIVMICRYFTMSYIVRRKNNS
jgi:hypothetical protein